MINSISLEGFKCFGEKEQIPLSLVNVMYGKNGRGKSTVAQALLLLAQTMCASNDISDLHLIGDLVELGTFNELLSVSNKTNTFRIDIESDDERVGLEFGRYPRKTQMAKLTKFMVNGVNRFGTVADVTGHDEKEQQSSSTSSDVMVLQNLKLAQYVSANRLGPRNSSPQKDTLQPEWIGVNGEYVINVLSSQGEAFQKEVSDVLSEVLTGATLKVRMNGTDRIELFLDSVNGGSEFRPVNVGFGYSYVLPVIVAALLAKKGSLLVVENPEAHLHPGAQSRLTKFLIEIAKTKDIQLLIETHSDHVVNGLRIAMKQKLQGTEPDDAEIVFFSHDEFQTQPKVEIIRCDKNGELSAYPDDFMDEWTNQLVKLI